MGGRRRHYAADGARDCDRSRGGLGATHPAAVKVWITVQSRNVRVTVGSMRERDRGRFVRPYARRSPTRIGSRLRGGHRLSQTERLFRRLAHGRRHDGLLRLHDVPGYSISIYIRARACGAADQVLSRRDRTLTHFAFALPDCRIHTRNPIGGLDKGLLKVFC